MNIGANAAFTLSFSHFHFIDEYFFFTKTLFIFKLFIGALKYFHFTNLYLKICRILNYCQHLKILISNCNCYLNIKFQTNGLQK